MTATFDVQVQVVLDITNADEEEIDEALSNLIIDSSVLAIDHSEVISYHKR